MTCPEKFDVCGVTREQFICQALLLVNLGDGAIELCGNRKETYCAIAGLFYDAFRRICDAKKELSPCTAEIALQQWIDLFIPDCGVISDAIDPNQAMCDLIAASGPFTCNTIVGILETSGYIVNYCGPNDDRETEPVELIYGFRTGLNQAGSMTRVQQEPCEAQYAGKPCTLGCCDGAEVDDEVIATDPCQSVSNEPSCSVINCTPVTPGHIDVGCYYPLKKPNTITVIIDPSSPAFGDICYGYQPNSVHPNHGQAGSIDASWPCPKDNCILDRLTPAHITIEYIVSCDIPAGLPQNTCLEDCT